MNANKGWLLGAAISLGASTSALGDMIAVPAPAARSAQEWFDGLRAKDPALVGAHLGVGYAVVSMSPRGTVEFMGSDDVSNPMAFMDTVLADIRFPILKADTCFSQARVYRDTDYGFQPLDIVEHQPDPLDVIVKALNRTIADGSNRVVVFTAPWPILCNTIIAELPDGAQLAFETDFSPRRALADSMLLSRGEPISKWSSQLKTRMREFYRLDRDPSSVARKIPPAAESEATRWKDARMGQFLKQLREIEGEATLGEPWVNYTLNPIEQLLYADSRELDPTFFDVDPTYNFPVIVQSELVAILNTRRARFGCDATSDSDSAGTYRVISVQLPGTGDWLPSRLEHLGEVAVLDMIDYYRWYYIAGRDSTWLTPFAPGTNADARQPLSELAASIKERIHIRLDR